MSCGGVSLGQEDSPGGGNSNPLQYSCLKNPRDCGLEGYNPKGHSQTWLSDWALKGNILNKWMPTIWTSWYLLWEAVEKNNAYRKMYIKCLGYIGANSNSGLISLTQPLNSMGRNNSLNKWEKRNLKIITNFPVYTENKEELLFEPNVYLALKFMPSFLPETFQ